MPVLQELIGTIYDAADQPALWNDVMARLVRETGASSGIFYDHNNETRQASILGAEGFDPHYLRRYEEYYAALDPWHRRGETRPVGELRQTASMLSDAELRRTEFYQDHLRPQGLFYAMGAPVERSRTRMAVFGIQGSYENGVFGPRAESLVRKLVPHFRRAYRMQETLDAVRREGMEFEAALHLLPQPVLVVDRDARLFFANAAGAQLLREGTLLRSVAGRVRAAHRGDVAALDRALHPVPQSGDGNGSLALRRAGDKAPATLRITPLRRRNRAEWSGRIALVVELPPPRGLATWAAAFHLSPAETRLWTALSAGRRLLDIAEESGTSVNTVRVQLRTLFQKTGVHRQADLLRLALEFGRASPENPDT
ncbi:helix-turn-helix transcriptional regulator [Dongia sedimenti]|uniref:Helix-turn-helix transcriptional regulator n=1 Tax=Dongia sedimenti TaxID=3064282 RepID=A0ABU0YMY5_9PROT|nr:helix-turn-helix transcriptional regulator [Rhodospirillaceae bacterium R-7]